MKKKPPPKLTAEMKKCLDALKEHGKLVRYRGGFWSTVNAELDPIEKWPKWYIGTKTIDALIRRNLIAGTGQKESGYGPFFVEVQLLNDTSPNT